MAKSQYKFIEEEDKILRYFSILVIILVLASASYLTARISLKYKSPVGDDFRFHIKAATIYARGENALVNKDILNLFGGPYPPLFHIFLAIFVKLGIAIQAATLLQFLFYPMILFATAFLVWKKKGIIAAAITIVLMFSSIALFDRGMQVTPQAVDMILFPFAIISFLENKKIPFIILMLIMIYSHGYFILLLFSGIALFSFIEKRNRDFIGITALFSLPLIILFLSYLPNYLRAHKEINLFFADPLFIFSYFSIQLTFFLPLALFYYFTERKNLDEFDKLSFYWLLGTALLLFTAPERFASYAVMPASIIISRMLKKFSSINKFIGIFLLIEIFIFGFFTNFMRWLNVLYGLLGERFNVA